MTCTHCGGLTQELERILDMQIRVTIDRCLICCREVERGYVPQPAKVELRGRPMPGPRWRAPAKTHEMEG